MNSDSKKEKCKFCGEFVPSYNTIYVQVDEDNVVRGTITCDLESDEYGEHPPLIVIDGKEIKWEDFGQMLLELEGGLVASISIGRTGWRSHPGGGLNRTFLIGTKGCALIDAHRPRVEVWGDVEPWRPPERNPDDPMGMWAMPPGSPFSAKPRWSWLRAPSTSYVTDVSHFLDCIEMGKESVVSAEVAAAATEVLMASYRSTATHKTVTV